MILVDEKRNIFGLHTPGASYVLGVTDGRFLCHLYYGRRIADDDIAYFLHTQENPYTPSVNPGERVSFYGKNHFEYPCFGTGDFRESCLNARNAQGQLGAELFFKSYAVVNGKRELPGLPASFGENCQTLEIRLEDPALGLTVTLSYSVFEDVDVITRSVSVKNEDENPVFLTRVLSACLDMNDPSAGKGVMEHPGSSQNPKGFRVLTFGGAWAREHIIQTQELVCGSVTAEALRGEAGHDTQPFIALVSPDCGQEWGEVYGMHFVYSGNFLGKVQKDSFDSVRMVMGIHPEAFEWKLEPGEIFYAPEVVLTYSAGGLGKMTQNLHDFYRSHLIRSPWQYRERPVLINNWEATYFDFDIPKLLDIVEEAHKCGIEMLVCDDGWFGEYRESPQGGLGDWFVNEKKLEGGFAKLRESLREKGMKFGLWFEPEMIAPQSKLYEEHPDWVLRLYGREPGMCRGQWVLDLSNPAVREYLYERMAALIRENSVDYVKWDMNRPLSDVGSSYLPADRQGELWHRHVLGLYEIQERLLSEFPELLLENCSSGGARFDPGMLYYSPQIWCSDNMDIIERQRIEEGTALLYPVSSIGAHVCKEQNDITGRHAAFETRALTAMLGTFGYELDITQISEEERAAIPGQIERYKSIRGIIQQGDYYHLSSWRLEREVDVTEMISKDKSEGFVLCVQPLALTNACSRRIRLRGLEAGALYEVSGEGIIQNGDFTPVTSVDSWGNGLPAQDRSCGVVRLHGDTLMNAGYLMERVKQDGYAVMHRIQKIME